ncbi:helix-turn-helix domain-containing protein [Flavobacteriaceae bacterium M23B6Z8]
MTFNIKYTFFHIPFILFIGILYGQDSNTITPDFLNHSSYEDIYEAYLEVFEDTIKSKVYLNAYIDKAQKENNLQRKAEGLTYLSYYKELESEKIALLDSAISILLIDSLNAPPPILQYSFKGGYYRDKGAYKKALSNYLKALGYAEKTNNTQYEYITKHNIGVLKLSVSKYDQAISLFKECLEYDKQVSKTETHGHSKTLLYISEAYLKKKKLDSAYSYINIGLSKTKENFSDLYNEFLILDGIRLFYKGEHEIARVQIEKAIFHLNERNPQIHRSLIIGYFYLGKINTILNNRTKATFNYLKLDSLMSQSKILFPEYREAYQFLINHYKKEDNKTKQLEFVNKLLVFDSINLNDKYLLTNRITTEFDTPILLKKKEELINELLDEKKSLYFILSISFFMLVAICGMLIYQYRKRQVYKNKFLELIEKQNGSNTITKTKQTKQELDEKSKELDISPQIIKKILKDLEAFEEDKVFLNKDLTSLKLANLLKTNIKYLSQIINHYKKKSFSNYIKDLRIDYAIERLKEDSLLRRYTIRSIAEEVGFNSTASFSSAFKEKTGIKPSYFIKKYNDLQSDLEDAKFMNFDT